jgi:outer membrane protein assembly factor BamB
MECLRLLLIAILLLNSCCKDDNSIVIDENGVIVSKPWLWRTEISKNTLNGAYISGPAQYDGQVLMGAMDENNIAYFACLDINNGEFLWKQNYIYSSDFFSFREFYSYRNTIIHREGTNIFSLNLSNGNYNWKQKVDGSAWHWPSGLDSLFFIYQVEAYSLNNYPVISACYGNIKDGNTNLFLIPDLGDLPLPDSERMDFAIGGFRYIKPFYDTESHDIMLLCYYEKQYYLQGGGSEQVSKSYVGLYNFSGREWVYERTELGNYNFLEGFTPTIIGDRFYHILSSGVLECRELYTGKSIWRNENIMHQYSNAGFLIIDNKMIVMDDRNRKLIAINIATGSEIWSETSAPTISFMSELNGVVYYASSADGRIHAVDIETGKHIWLLKSPDATKNPDDYFMQQCIVIPGDFRQKNRIIVSSFSHAYCFEAVR